MHHTLGPIHVRAPAHTSPFGTHAYTQTQSDFSKLENAEECISQSKKRRTANDTQTTMLRDP